MAKPPRIAPVDVAAAPPEVREVLSALPVQLNIFRMMAHAPTSLRPLLALGTSILAEQQLDPELREYAVLLAAKAFGGEYEWVQHLPIAAACGADPAQLAAIEQGQLDAACFDEREKAFLAFVQESATDVRCSDQAFAEARRHFSDRELVETILTIGFYQMLARLTECTDTPLDAPAGQRVLDALKSSR